MDRFIRKMIAVVLTASMCFSMIPTTAWAQVNANTDDNISEIEDNSLAVGDLFSDESVPNESQAQIVEEVVAMRESNVKHFQMSDHSMTAVVYPQDVHYLEDGAWLDIDNELVLMQADEETGFEGYQNKANRFSVRFAKSAGLDHMISLSDQDYKIDWGLAFDPTAETFAPQKSTIHGQLKEESPVTQFSAGQSDTADQLISQVTSQVNYSNVLPSVDFEYLPTADGIKENIIVNSATDAYEYAFNLSLTGLKARLTAENAVELYDEDSEAVKYYFPAPFMYDADGTVSYEVTYSLIPVEDEVISQLAPEETSLPSTQEADSSAALEEESSLPPSPPPLFQFSEKDQAAVSLPEKEDGEIVDGAVDSSPSQIEEVPFEEEASLSLEERFTALFSEEKLTSTNCYILTVSANEEWMNASGRSFPVTIDPILNYEKENSDLACVYFNVGRTKPYYNFSTTSVRIADNVYSYIHFSLPTLPDECAIESAIMAFGSSSGTEPTAKLYELDAPFDKDTITFANRPAYGNLLDSHSLALDYDSDGDPTWTLHKFDITKTARKWHEYPETNFGVGFDRSSVSGNHTISFGSNHYGYGFLRINYRAVNGLDYWPTHTQTVGRAGTGYVNDYSGNLTFIHTDLVTAGNRTPLTLQHIYNTNDRANHTDPFTKTGHGWRINYQQRKRDADGTLLESSTIEIPVTMQLIRGDADRLIKISDTNQTEGATNEKVANEISIHYATQAGSEIALSDRWQALMDEITLIKNSTFTSDLMKRTYLPKWKAAIAALADEAVLQLGVDFVDEYYKSIVTYYKKWYTTAMVIYSEASYRTHMSSLVSQLGKMSFYASIAKDRIVSIENAVGDVLTLTYNENGLLSSVNDPTQNDGLITYTYDTDENLTQITYPDGDATLFTYTDHKLTSVTDPTGYKISYNYDGKRVVRVEESVGEELGQAYQISYNPYYATTFRFAGSDDLLGNDDDIENIYTFDLYGQARTLTSQIVGSGEILGSSYYTYTAGSNEKLNRVKEYIYGVPKIVNLLSNSSFTKSSRVSRLEHYPTGWGKLYGTCTRTSCHSSNPKFNKGHTGGSCVKFEPSGTKHTGKIGHKQSKTLPAGTYTYSGYVKTVDMTDAQAYLKVTAGEQTYQTEALTGTSLGLDGNAWIRQSITFTLTQTTTVTVHIEVSGKSSGYACFDTMQLEESEAPSRYNYIEDASFESGTSGSAHPKWTNSTLSNAEHIDGALSLKLPESSSTKVFYEGISTNSKQNYQLSFWVKQVGGLPNRTFKLIITAGDDSTVSINPFADIGQWSYYSMTLPKLPTGYSYSRIGFSSGQSGGTIYIDNIQLTNVLTATTNTYNQKKMTSTTVADQKTSYSYNAHDQLLKTTLPTGRIIQNEYDDVTHDLTKTHSADLATCYAYDQFGNLSNTTVKSNSASPADTSQIYTENTYSQNGQFKTGIIDSRGYLTSYTYDPIKGLLQSTSNGKNVTTSYQYNGKNQVTSVSKSGITNTYGYDSKNQLNSITHNGFSYEFSYDSFGNRTNISVAGNPLSSYTYTAQNGRLTKTTYGNGYQVEPIYNEKEQRIGEKRNGIQVDSYHYTSDGKLGRYLDQINHLQYNYEYDEKDRLSGQQVFTASTGAWLYSFQSIFNTTGQAQKFIFSTPSGSKEYTYAYNEYDTIGSVTLPNSSSLTYAYDALWRVIGVQNKPAATSTAQNTMHTLFTYVDGANASETLKRTTSLVESYTNRLGGETDGIIQSRYTYTYDPVGNIAQITDLENRSIYYTYDDLSQLVREDNQVLGKTFVYVYDGGGNITETRAYAYTTGEVGTATSTDSYVYRTEGWRDQLLNFNGQSIAYDAIGNPLQYLGKSLTWSDGRQLSSVVDGDLSIGYTYGTNGIRLSKTVDGVQTKYVLNGAQILQQITGSETLNFYYDASGQISSIGYIDGSAAEICYFVTRNQQGDVVALYRSADASLVGTYTYDSWGKVMAITPASPTADPNGILQKNPFRYRGYYYDAETGWYYLQSRYYDPGVKRFLNADGVIPKTGKSVHGCNLFSYCFNSPASMDDMSGDWPKLISKMEPIMKNIIATSLKATSKEATSSSSSFTFANNVNKAHVTTPTAMLDGGPFIGKIGFSITSTVQNKEPGLFYSYFDIGNNENRYGAGINAGGWLAVGAGASSNANIFINAQVTPWVHAEVSLGLDGIGAVFGFDIDNTAYDFEIKGGWGLVAIWLGPQVVGSSQSAPASVHFK